MLALLAFALFAWTNALATPASAEGASTESAPRTLLFGDLHIHSGWSLDAFAAEVRARPRDAYRYARGEAIDHASGEKVKLAGPPLDFMALTEHAEYLLSLIHI